MGLEVRLLFLILSVELRSQTDELFLLESDLLRNFDIWILRVEIGEWSDELASSVNTKS